MWIAQFINTCKLYNKMYYDIYLQRDIYDCKTKKNSILSIHASSSQNKEGTGNWNFNMNLMQVEGGLSFGKENC